MECKNLAFGVTIAVAAFAAGWFYPVLEDYLSTKKKQTTSKEEQFKYYSHRTSVSNLSNTEDYNNNMEKCKSTSGTNTFTTQAQVENDSESATLKLDIPDTVTDTTDYLELPSTSSPNKSKSTADGNLRLQNDWSEVDLYSSLPDNIDECNSMPVEIESLTFTKSPQYFRISITERNFESSDLNHLKVKRSIVFKAKQFWKNAKQTFKGDRVAASNIPSPIRNHMEFQSKEIIIPICESTRIRTFLL